ncbi:DUF4231 domain-containing protein [Streptomyces lomondensis]|uniref:SMODS and SLOG-associating 2TM effector domain-containing protein n=1 Tax=Streptomyces lomondensis TaxID=68229 RepID=A0ABQ2XIC6_9ACTN|nr:DUF4231 domain-containing protein [Streptomyces lomondensis]MCF0082766.1 DUF4231 domain-containing protein [Streptomyces lomondensis]GGX17986.1 hypothetical protein GCM10010383_54910 [Streptomyces lomondensis]
MTAPAGVIEQHRIDSRKYRRVHNTLQNLILIGSASTTVVAALDTPNQYTWQNITIVSIGFTGTVAAAFTGYYKYRERSYSLLQTADAIEEEANAFTLGVGPYSDFGEDQEQQALKLFTQRVEEHRNEQRRRQQQLDQPADQAAPGGARRHGRYAKPPPTCEPGADHRPAHADGTAAWRNGRSFLNREEGPPGQACRRPA